MAVLKACGVCKGGKIPSPELIARRAKALKLLGKRLLIGWKGNKKIAVPKFDRACHRWGTPEMCKGCYCRGGGLYFHARNNELWLQAHTPQQFVDEMTRQIRAKGYAGTLRVHTAGEFDPMSKKIHPLHGAAYLEAWKVIAKLNPRVTFYTYTKEPWLSIKGLPKNLIIHANTLKNFGSAAWCFKMLRKNPLYFLCPCGLPGISVDKICGVRCKKCIDLPSQYKPLFIEH